MKLIIRLTLLICICVHPFYAESGVFKKVWKKVSSLPNQIGGLIGGVTGVGGFVGSAFEPAIQRYEEANRKSILLLDQSLNTRLNQFNGILEARVNQIDEVFKSSIYLMDESVKQNLEKIDQTLKNRIGQLNGGLTNVSYGFASSLWTVFRGVATIAIIVLVVFLTTNFVSKFRANKKLNEQNKALTRKFIFNLTLSILAFVIILFFQPSIFKRFNDPSFVRELTEMEQRLKYSAESLNYDECIYYASVLSSYQPASNLYQYYLYKYEILRDLSYRPKLSLFAVNNIQEIQTKYKLLDTYKDKLEEEIDNFRDPDYQILLALFFNNFAKNKEGDLIAAYFSLLALEEVKAIKDAANKEQNGELAFPLEAIAADYIRQYQLHPLPTTEAKEILVKHDILNSSDPLPDLQKQVAFECSSTNGLIFCTNYAYNSIVKELLQKDEQDFVKFMESARLKDEVGMDAIAAGFVKRWSEATDKVDELNMMATNITAKLPFLNDAYLSFVLSLRGDKLIVKEALAKIETKLKPVQESLFPLTAPPGLDPSIQYNTTKTEYEKLPVFKRYLLGTFLLKFSFLSRLAYIRVAVLDNLNDLTVLKDLEGYYRSYKDLQTSSPSIQQIVLTYKNLIRSCLETDFYLYGSSADAYALLLFTELKRHQATIEQYPDAKKTFEDIQTDIRDNYLNKSITFL